MDLLQYLSDSEPEEENTVDLEEKVEPHSPGSLQQPSGLKYSQNTNSSVQDVQDLDSSSISTSSPSLYTYPIDHPILRHPLYLENYTAQHNMYSGYVYSPWRPSLKDKTLFQNMTKLAMAQIEKQLPEFYSRYNWHTYDEIRSVNAERFAVSNRFAVNNYHITVLPNINGDRHKIKQFQENIAHGIRNMKIDPSLLRRDSLLDALLQKGTTSTAKGKQVVGLTFLPTLTLRPGQSQSVFLTADIKANAESAAGGFFRNLQDIMVDQVETLGLEVFRGGEKIDRESIVSFHISACVGYRKSLVTSVEYADVNKATEIVKNCKVDHILDKITLNIDQVVCASNIEVGDMKVVKLPTDR